LRSANAGFWSGVGLLVASNLVGSYTNIMVVRRKEYNISPVALTSFANFTGGLGLIVVSLLVEHPVLASPPPVFWIALVWLAIIPAGAFSLWYGLLQRPGVKVSELNVWKFMVPVFGCLLAWILLPEEHPDWTSLIGIAVIVGALWLLQGRGKKSV
jgi:drug/metabolite transporter (DMT)-like permease